MGIELKPCPFCGKKADFVVHSTFSNQRAHGIEFHVECSWCKNARTNDGTIKFDLGYSGKIVMEPDDRQKIADEWNRRSYET